MTQRFGTQFVQAIAPLALLLNAGAEANSEGQRATFEPALRELWLRGSERFHRQWLIAGPVDAAVAVMIDPASIKPADGQALNERNSDVRWAAHTSWTDVTDLNAIGNRVPTIDAQGIDRFMYVAGSLLRAVAGTVELSIGSTRPYALWVNGKEAHTRNTTEGFAPDRDRIPVEFRKGENFVLLRLRESSAGPSQFSLRAVSPGTALPRVEEISPTLVSTTDEALKIRTHFAREGDAAPVLIEVLSAGGSVVAKSSAARGDVVEFDPGKWRDGAYEIRIATQNAWKQPSIRYLPWYKGDSIAAVRSLIEAAATAKQDAHGEKIRMLAALATDRLGGAVEKASRVSWPLVHSPLMEFEELELDRTGGNGSVRAGGFLRIAYVDEVDGSTQFCRAYLPSEYDPAKPWPLVTFLHGYNPPNPAYIRWWSVDERHNAIADTKGTIVIEPHARGNAQYMGAGERDVLRCLDEAKRRFSIDADRIYLTGESMGGHGTWRIASRHPDLFAAAAPVYGGWDFRITNVSAPTSVPQPENDLDAFSFERASSFANAENLLHVPLLVLHGDVDPAVNVENSRHAVKLLQRWGYDIRYHEMPGWAHEDLGQRANVVDWLLTHKRVTAPTTIRLRSVDLAGASAYWIDVRAFENPSQVIRVSAEVLQPGVVRVDSTNVAAFAINLPATLRGQANKLKVTWNGQTNEVSLHDNVAELGSLPRSSGLRKRAGMEGPMPAILATPFAVVIGTSSSDPHMNEVIRARADGMAQQWHDWQHAPLRILKDTEVSAEDERRYSLMLLGGANANAVTRRLGTTLPFSAAQNRIVVDGREWAVTDSVLQAIYPNPTAPDRYVYVVAPTSPEGMHFWKPQLVHFVHGYQLTMFDWVIQDGRRPPPGTMNPATANVASGVFDANWRRQDRWTSERDQKLSSQWSLRTAPPRDFAPSASALQAVAGRYELFPSFVFTFRVDGSSLVVDVPGGVSIPLTTESDSVFVNPSNGDAVEFLRDAQGRVSAASVEDHGSILLAKRLP
jgi:predicted esterase